MTNYDVVIRNGTVVDGSGMAGYRADVGIVGDRIARIGRIAERGAQEIDATGHIVTPGFVDLHTHMDAQVFWDPLGSCSCWHGVTTVLMGNCGFSLAPAHDANRDLVVRNIERAEAIDPGAMAAGLDGTGQGFDQYLDAVDKQPKGINYAALVGHSAVRTWVMGEEAFSREATADEVERMRSVLADAMRSGAWGLSTSRSWAHLTPAGDAVASRQASWDEVCSLVDVLAEHGRGVFEIAPEMASFSSDVAERTGYPERINALAVDGGVPVMFGIVAAKPGADD